MSLCVSVGASMWHSEDNHSIIAQVLVAMFFEIWSSSGLVVPEYIRLGRECWDLLVFPSPVQGLQYRPACLGFLKCEL